MRTRAHRPRTLSPRRMARKSTPFSRNTFSTSSRGMSCGTASPWCTSDSSETLSAETVSEAAVGNACFASGASASSLPASFIGPGSKIRVIDLDQGDAGVAARPAHLRGVGPRLERDKDRRVGAPTRPGEGARAGRRRREIR